VDDVVEVVGGQPEQGGAVDLGVPADEVVQLGVEGVVVDVAERLVGGVAASAEHGLGVPVVPFTGQVVAAFEQQDLLAGLGELRGSTAAAGSAADDDDVVMIARCRCWWCAHSPTLPCMMPPSTTTVVAVM